MIFFKKYFLLIAVSALLIHGYSWGVKNGYDTDSSSVCDQNHALDLAKKELKKKYGERDFNRYKPYAIKSFSDSLYLISGTVKTGKGGSGVVYIYKSSCKIKEITHYK